MNNHSPLVSIISPTYNHEKFIATCIESVLTQSYANWEMIIIDDGSTDNTFQIALEYARKDPRIKPFTQKNIGIFRLGESYNFALSHCAGEYIAILECDDVWFPEKLGIQIEDLENHPQCVLSWGRAYFSSIDLSRNYSLSNSNIGNPILFFNKPVGAFLKEYIFHNIPPALTIIIRKESLLEIGGFIQDFNLPLVDIPTTMELIMKGEFSFIDQPLGQWRTYPNQVTKTHTGEMTMGYYKLVQSLMMRFPKIFEDQKIFKKEIDSHFQKKLVMSYSRSGRYKLIRKNFSGARRDYIHSIMYYGLSNPVWKLRSLIGLFFSLFRMDIEWLAKLIGNISYK